MPPHRPLRTSHIAPVPGVERLECRVLLTAYTVNTLADVVAADGFVTLREAIQAANTNAAVHEAAAGQSGVQDTITFAPGLAGGTITLAGSELEVLGDLAITGLGANRLTVSGNNASRVFNVASEFASVTISGLTITGGRAPGSGFNAGVGGGVFNEGTLNFIGCVISGNAAAVESGFGGGIYNAGNMTLLRSLLSDNTAIGSGPNAFSVGGGLANNGTVYVINSTVSGNRAGLQGGGIHNLGALRIRNSTVFGNRIDDEDAGLGGGIRQLSGATQIFNTIVAGNFLGTGGTPDDVWVTGSSLVGTHNLISDPATAGGMRNRRDNNIVGVDWRAVLDPVLRDNGGPTKTHPLLPGSRAIDAGSNSWAIDAANQPLTTDQRGTGFVRIRQGRVDIGAFEAAPAADLIGYLSGGWWVGASTGTSFDNKRWATWSDFAWDALGQADFTGDGKADVFGLVDGAWWVGASTGSSFATSRWALWSNLAWQDVKAADLNADGKADVLARVGGNWWVALSTGAGFAAPKLWASWASLDWREFFATDLTGDGRADLLGYARGQWWAGFAQNTGSFSGPFLLGTWSDAAWQKLLVLDANGDGRSDVAGLLGGGWWVGQTVVTEFETFFQTRRWAAWSNLAWADPVTGDFDGDGKDDVAARTGGSWWVGLSTGAAFAAPAMWAGWSNATWADVRVADFDGDGRDDLAGRLNGQWWVARSTGAGFTTSLWGTWSDAAWRAVVAADATGPTAASAASGSATSASFAASQRAVAICIGDDEPLAVFWSKAERDDEFDRRLLA